MFGISFKDLLTKEWHEPVKNILSDVIGYCIRVYNLVVLKSSILYYMPLMNHPFMKCPRPLMEYPQSLTSGVTFAVHMKEMI